MRTVERHPDAVEAIVEDELVVMNIKSLEYYRFNPVASRIWQLLESGPASEDHICATLLDEYEVDEAECQSAVDDFLSDALTKGFVREA